MTFPPHRFKIIKIGNRFLPLFFRAFGRGFPLAFFRNQINRLVNLFLLFSPSAGQCVTDNNANGIVNIQAVQPCKFILLLLLEAKRVVIGANGNRIIIPIFIGRHTD